MTTAAASAPGALEPLAGLRILTAWRLDVPVLVVVAGLGAGYLIAAHRVRERGGRWSRWRSAAFCLGGLGSAVVVTMSCLGVYDRVLFWPRAVQYTAMVGLTPMLLAIGQPLELARGVLGERGRRRLDATLRSPALRAVAFPLTGALLGLAALLAVYLSPLYHAALVSGAVHHLVLLGLALVGVAFFVPELDPAEDLLPAWCGPALRVLFALVDGLVDALPGVVIMTMHGTIAEGYYRGLNRTWGPSVKWDQTIGGGLMFTIGELIALPFLVLLVVAWIRSDEQQARETDRLLAGDTPAAVGSTGPETAPDGSHLGPSTRPWWETEPGPLRDRTSGR